MSKPFKIEPYNRAIDKRFTIEGPDQLRLYVDNDDVDSKVVAKAAKKMVAILNENWKEDDPQKPCPVCQEPGCKLRNNILHKNYG